MNTSLKKKSYTLKTKYKYKRIDKEFNMILMLKEMQMIKELLKRLFKRKDKCKHDWVAIPGEYLCVCDKCGKVK